MELFTSKSQTRWGKSLPAAPMWWTSGTSLPSQPQPDKYTATYLTSLYDYCERNNSNNYLSCPRDHSIEIVNGNYGRFTITLCNNKVTPSHCLCFVLSIHLTREPKTGQSTATLSLRWLTWLAPATAGSPAPSVRRPSPSTRTPARAQRGTSRRTTSALPTKVNFDWLRPWVDATSPF